MLRLLHIFSTLVIAVAVQASLLSIVGAQSTSTGSTGCVDATNKPATDDAKGASLGGRPAIANRAAAARPAATTADSQRQQRV
jgi:hypothetical protein